MSWISFAAEGKIYPEEDVFDRGAPQLSLFMSSNLH